MALVNGKGGDYAHHGGRHQMAKKKMAQSNGAVNKGHHGHHYNLGTRTFLN